MKWGVGMRQTNIKFFKRAYMYTDMLKMTILFAQRKTLFPYQKKVFPY